MNRSWRREVIRALVSQGCTCSPQVHHRPVDETAPPGVTSGAWVRHQAGCVLGDQVRELNDRGITPAFVHVEARCER